MCTMFVTFFNVPPSHILIHRERCNVDRMKEREAQREREIERERER